MADNSSDTDQVLDHLFRNEYGKIISHLTRTYGPTYIEFIEDAVQEALIKAMNTWAFGTIPNNPSGWIYRAAKNNLIDQLRRNAKLTKGEGAAIILENEANNKSFMKDVLLDSELEDDQLRMIFACCHPLLSEEQKVILTLKLLCGFGKSEIARALLKKEDAVAKSITRARNNFKVKVGELRVPQGTDLMERLGSVLKVLYLMFNEGYSSSTGDDLLKQDLCDEAIRLTSLMEAHPDCNTSEVQALLALMYFHSARFSSRTDKDGEFLSLDKQDRSLWERERISKAILHLNNASEKEQFSEYHIQAGMAYYHATAPSFEETAWDSILQLYDIQMRYFPNNIVALNRTVVLQKVKGSAAALTELNQLEKELADYRLFHAIKADFLKDTGKIAEALRHMDQAITLSSNQKEINHLQRKKAAILN